ncbi:MAG: hypothetical protein JO279_17360 [Verrucomicrobia bacterium]|nr:hypothetical protein [Verrucomicrobiota bacterium]
MRKEINKSMEDLIELITRALHDSMLEIQFVSQNRSRKELSRVRAVMLQISLRRAIGCARKLEKSLAP